MIASEAAKRPLRLALLMPAERAYAWQEHIAAQLAANAELAVDICRVAIARRPSAYWHAMTRSIERGHLTAATVALAADACWDVVVDLAGIAAAEPWRRRSRHGVWQPLDAHGVHVAAAFPCHEAICAGKGGELFLVRDGERVLISMRFSASPHYMRALPHIYARSALLIQAGLSESIHDSHAGMQPAFTPRPLPSRVRRILHDLHGHALSCHRRLVRQWLSESWMIGVIEAPIQHTLDTRASPKIKWLGQRDSGRYFADPFGVPDQHDRLYCEAYSYSDGRGHIEAITLDGNGEIARAEPIALSSSGHASYPYLFKHGGRLYGVPETVEQRRCELYEVDGDGRWLRVATLLEDVAAADATIFFWQGLYWLAYTDLALGAFDNLCLAYAVELDGPWLRHARYPVKLDHRSSRPAGTPFVHEGELYRPAQDCGSTYGEAVVINRVIVCTPQDYREEMVRICPPDPQGRNPHGLHTLSAWGERTLVDGKRMVFNRHEWMRKLRRKLAGA